MKKIIIVIFLIVSLLGVVIFIKQKTDNSLIEEHIISISSNNKKVDAVSGSFCYKDGCIDKIDFQDFPYDIMPTYYGNKLYISNLDGTIKSIELFDYSIREFIDERINYTNDWIITPNISGTYIFIIKAIYEGKNISYYFMAEVSKTNDEDINVTIDLKKDTLTDRGLTMVVKNLSDKNLEYGNPYTIEKYEDSYWKTVEPKKELSFTLPAYSLNKNDSVELIINWESGYGKLKGKYRIVKNFAYLENDEYVSFNKYLEFYI